MVATPALDFPIVNLEPIAGAGLAVTLAYLALDRFRYRQLIETAGERVFAVFQKNGHGVTIDEALEALNDLKWLCRKECNGHMPRGFGPMFYGWSFRRQADELIISVLAVLSALTLISGVALNAGIWSWVTVLNSQLIVGFLFYSCSSAIIFPAAMVLCGRRCVDWGKKFADHCEDQINKIMKNSARAASAPAATPAVPVRPGFKLTR